VKSELERVLEDAALPKLKAQVSPKHSAETVNEDKINVFSFQYVVII
jgi:hypothetical protein